MPPVLLGPCIVTTLDLSNAGRLVCRELNFGGNDRVQTVVLPRGADALRVGAFACCRSLRKVRMDKCGDLLELPDYLFAVAGCRQGLEVALPPALAKIGEHAFASSSVRFIILPASMRLVGSRAFSSCRRLRTVELSGSTPPKFAKAALEHAPVVLSGPKACIKKACTDGGWFGIQRHELRRRALQELLLVQRLVSADAFRRCHSAAVEGTVRGVRDSEVTKARRNRWAMLDPRLQLPCIPPEIWFHIFDMAPGWRRTSAGGMGHALQSWTTKWRANYSLSECRLTSMPPRLWSFLVGRPREDLEKLCRACGHDVSRAWRVHHLAHMVCTARCGAGGILRAGRNTQEKHVEWAVRVICG